MKKIVSALIVNVVFHLWLLFKAESAGEAGIFVIIVWIYSFFGFLAGGVIGFTIEVIKHKKDKYEYSIANIFFYALIVSLLASVFESLRILYG
jgi:hypothetical protein